MTEVKKDLHKFYNQLLKENSKLEILQHKEDDQFRENILHKIEEYLIDLENHDYLNVKNCNKTELGRLCIKTIEKIFNKYRSKERSVYKRIPCRNKDPKYIACCILYCVLELHYEMDYSKVSHTDFRNIFRDAIHQSSFSTTLKFLREEIIDVDTQLYTEKTIIYAKKYLEILKNYYNLEINEETSINTIKNSIDYLTKNKILGRETYITKKSERNLQLTQILGEHGLNIQELFKNYFYQNFLPQYLAIFLVTLL